MPTARRGGRGGDERERERVCVCVKERWVGENRILVQELPVEPAGGKEKCAFNASFFLPGASWHRC